MLWISRVLCSLSGGWLVFSILQFTEVKLESWEFWAIVIPSLALLALADIIGEQ